MQPVTQNRKYPKGLNNIPCVIRSCIVACNLLHEIGNAGKGLNNVPSVVRLCNKLHATFEMNNAQYVDWKNISKEHCAFFVYRMSLWREWWVEIALIAQAAIPQTKKARSLTLL